MREKVEKTENILAKKVQNRKREKELKWKKKWKIS